MMKDSNGQVRTSGHSFSERCLKNQEVGGVPNSTHLTGFVDGQTWIFQLELDEGLSVKSMVGSGTTTWDQVDGHFDYTGQGGGNLSNQNTWFK